MWLTENQSDLEARQKRSAAAKSAKAMGHLLDTIEIANNELRTNPPKGEVIDLIATAKAKAGNKPAKVDNDTLSESDKRYLRSQGWYLVDGHWTDHNIQGQGVDPRLLRTHNERNAPRHKSAKASTATILRIHKEVA